MDTLEEKLNSILGNPELMTQIASMAQSLGKSQESDTAVSANISTPSPAGFSLLPDLDPSLLFKISSIIQGIGIDPNQQNLLNALRPYISAQRIIKLEKAMRAAKLAGFASTLLSDSGLQL